MWLTSLGCLLVCLNVTLHKSDNYPAYSVTLQRVTLLFPLTHPHNPGTKPTLQELLRFKCTDGRVVSVPVEVATKYVHFGIFLLDDQNGSKVKNIAHKNHCDAEQINTEIFQEWLTGRGKKPVTWTTLVEVLRDIELSTLAGDIEAVKCPLLEDKN